MPKEYRQTKFRRPEGATEVLLVRHGESEPAIPGQPHATLGGHGDPGLHPEGQRQAQLLGERLKSYAINTVYVSNLCRTHQTAAPLCAHLGLEPNVEPDLREVYLGDWEAGLFRIKEQEQDPLVPRMLQEQRWDVIPGAESNESLQTRLVQALERIRCQHPDELVVAVVHGGVIGQILAYATGARTFAFLGAANASISKIFLLEDASILVRGFNDTAHLDS